MGQDGLYDPSDFNDRLVLGLKATMSEAELHILRSRLQKGIVSKAQRGELKQPLPIGLVYDPAQRVVLDPDQQVQQALRHFFNTFRRCGSAWTTVAAFRKEGLKFPRKQNGRDEVVWGPPEALRRLAHPAQSTLRGNVLLRAVADLERSPGPSSHCHHASGAMASADQRSPSRVYLLGSL